MATKLLNFFEQAVSLFASLFTRPDWRDWLDIALVAVLIYYGRFCGRVCFFTLIYIYIVPLKLCGNSPKPSPHVL